MMILGALVLGCAGAFVLAFNIVIAIRAVVWRARVRHISGVPFLGGATACLALLMVGPSRAWAWIPLVVDPCGLLPFLVGLAWQMRPPKS